MTLYQILLEMASENEAHVTKGKQTHFLTLDLKNKSISSGSLFILQNKKIVLDKIRLSNKQEYNLQDMELLHEDLSDLQEFNRDLYNLVAVDGLDTINILRNMFNLYYKSIPGEVDKFRKCKFATKSTDAFTDEELVSGISRCMAQYLLEGYIILSSLSGLTWGTTEKWFKKISPEFILLKEWCW